MQNTKSSTRRDFLQRGSLAALGAIAAPALLIPRGSAQAAEYTIKSDKVIWADYGGTTRAASVAAWLQPFQEKTRVTYLLTDADPAKFQLFAERKKADWDLMNLDG